MRRLHLPTDRHLAHCHAHELILALRGAMTVSGLLLQLLVGGLIDVDHIFSVFARAVLLLLLNVELGGVRCGLLPSGLVHGGADRGGLRGVLRRHMELVRTRYLV